MDDDIKKEVDKTEQVEDSKIDFRKLSDKGSKGSKLDRIVTIVLLTICVALAASVILNMGGDEKAITTPDSAETAAVINVQAEAAEEGTFIRTTRINGEIGSDGTSVSVVPDTSGKISKILVRKGDMVKKGDVIAYVDPSRPGSSFLESPVTAPVDGEISDVPAIIGQTVSVSTPVATIVGDKTLNIVAKVPERYIGTLELGLEATFTSIAYPGEEFTGSITYISPNVDTTTRTAEIELEILSDTSKLKEGMYVSLSLVTERIENALMVPTTAVSEFTGGNIVYVADGTTARRTVVETGSSNGVSTVILSGLNPGDMVITAGTVADGSTINVLQ